MKVCTKCQSEKSLDNFHKDKKAKDGHVSECKDCVKQKSRLWYLRNKDLALDKARIYASKNPEKVKLYQSKYRKSDKGRASQKRYSQKAYSEDPFKFREKSKNYRQRNPSKRSYWQQTREARKLKACPEWLTEQQRDDIQRMYDLRDKFRKIFGVDYHVDHIVPLQGKNVCGLHVPWNLQILEASMNLKKSNTEEFYSLRDHIIGD